MMTKEQKDAVIQGLQFEVNYLTAENARLKADIADLNHDLEAAVAEMSEQAKAAACPEKPERLLGQPIGQYHCPSCGMMLIAGLPHPSPSEDNPDFDLLEKEEAHARSEVWYDEMAG